jgi:hypothetical protein
MIPTAEEFLRGKPFSIESIHSNMIQFAKLHVEAALSNVDRLASLKCNNGKEFRDFIDENSILNAYSLTNIK